MYLNIVNSDRSRKRNKAARTALKADDQYPGGDFRSAECVELLKQADIVVTNPPFGKKSSVTTITEAGEQSKE